MFVGDWTATLSFVIQFGSAKTSAEVTSTTALAQKLTCSSTWVEFRKFRVFFLVYLSEVDRGCTRAKIFYGEDDYRWDLLVSCAATNPKCMIFAAWPDRLFPPCLSSPCCLGYSLYCCFVDVLVFVLVVNVDVGLVLVSCSSLLMPLSSSSFSCSCCSALLLSPYLHEMDIDRYR